VQKWADGQKGDYGHPIIFEKKKGDNFTRPPLNYTVLKYPLNFTFLNFKLSIALNLESVKNYGTIFFKKIKIPLTFILKKI
jgi:hypothetical protein